MAYTIFNKQIDLRKGKAILRLSECNYPYDYIAGITAFWQKVECPSECKGILSIQWGINFVPWIDFRFPVEVCVTCVDDSIFSYYVGNAWSEKEAIAKLTKIIDEKRNKYGFRLSEKEVRHINEKVASLDVA
ncbi:MAG: hypothetical protein V7L20_26255 [Nostoc sp.]|uniref:hypothetical protein n=1 Tax=Nostoc sp. TaxID=1180 RepID=UPI002FFB7A1B